MEKSEIISVEQCCVYYKIETSFVKKLDEYGLIELTRSGRKVFIPYEQLVHLEKYMHLHYDLDINMEGIEAIHHLLNRVQNLQQEIKRLHAQLEKD